MSGKDRVYVILAYPPDMADTYGENFATSFQIPDGLSPDGDPGEVQALIDLAVEAAQEEMAQGNGWTGSVQDEARREIEREAIPLAVMVVDTDDAPPSIRFLL